MTARTAAMVLQARNVALSDVFEARAQLEPLAARSIAAMRGRRSVVAELRDLITLEEAAVEDPRAFGVANAVFHEHLVALAGNQTLAIVAEMINEIVARAVTAVSQADDVTGSLSVRRKGIRSQLRLLELLEAGDGAAAEEFWRGHMGVVGRVMLGQESSTVVDLLHHDD
jgi:GntR family transcriptional repressor for pyruvate dehydrogenase complex